MGAGGESSHGSIRTGFKHGVASFDPTPSSVLIWTRFTVPDPQAEVMVDWQISESEEFTTVLARC